MIEREKYIRIYSYIEKLAYDEAEEVISYKSKLPYDNHFHDVLESVDDRRKNIVEKWHNSTEEEKNELVKLWMYLNELIIETMALYINE